jgi:predicted GNAT family N-acyltransferase
MDFSIIQVTNTDELKKCLAIREKVFIIEKDVPREIENDEFDAIRNDCEHFLILCNSLPVGTVRMRFLENDVMKLQRFCFLKEYRHLGLGSKTVTFIEERYRKFGKVKIVIEAKYAVSPFYEKCGYKKVSDIFYEVGVKHVNMEKQI